MGTVNSVLLALIVLFWVLVVLFSFLAWNSLHSLALNPTASSFKVLGLKVCTTDSTAL